MTQNYTFRYLRNRHKNGINKYFVEFFGGFVFLKQICYNVWFHLLQIICMSLFNSINGIWSEKKCVKIGIRLAGVTDFYAFQDLLERWGKNRHTPYMWICFRALIMELVIRETFKMIASGLPQQRLFFSNILSPNSLVIIPQHYCLQIWHRS